MNSPETSRIVSNKPPSHTLCSQWSLKSGCESIFALAFCAFALLPLRGAWSKWRSSDQRPDERNERHLMLSSILPTWTYSLACLRRYIESRGLLSEIDKRYAVTKPSWIESRVGQDSLQPFCTSELEEKPKKVIFLGTDGRHYPFLCKAEKRGDLRKERMGSLRSWMKLNEVVANLSLVWFDLCLRSGKCLGKPCTWSLEDSRLMEFAAMVNQLLAKSPEPLWQPANGIVPRHRHE